MAKTNMPLSCGGLPGRQFLTVLALALVVRLATLALLQTNLHADPDAYVRLANTVVATGTYGLHRSADGHVQPTAYRPPLYTLLLAALTPIPIEPWLRIAGVHLVAGVVTVALVLMLGHRLGLGRTAALAGLLIAVDPILLYQSTLVMTETMATLLAAAALLALVAAGQRPSFVRAGLAGAILALASLCRPIFLPVLAVASAVLIVIAPPGRRWSIAGAVLAGALLVLSPWVVRNSVQMKRPIVATTHGGYTLWLGNNRSFYAFLRSGSWGAVWAGPDSIAAVDRVPIPSAIADTPWPARELALDRWYYHEAGKLIVQHPGTFVLAALVRLGRLWQLVPHQVDPREGARRRLVRYAVGGWYLAELTLAGMGIWFLGRRITRPAWVWGTLLCGCVTLVHLCYWTNMRMRAPLMPVVALLVGSALHHLPPLRALFGR